MNEEISAADRSGRYDRRNQRRVVVHLEVEVRDALGDVALVVLDVARDAVHIAHIVARARQFRHPVNACVNAARHQLLANSGEVTFSEFEFDLNQIDLN